MKLMREAPYGLLVEACRRYTRFGVRQGKGIEDAWTGLGFRSEYRPLIESGLMVWACSEPAPRCMGWLKLTPRGAGIVQAWIGAGFNFETIETGGDLPPRPAAR